MSIIKSLFDLDLYKITVHQIVFHRFNNLITEYEFKCRNETNVLPKKYINPKTLREEINKLENLQLQPDELEWMQKQDYFSPEYINYMKHFRLDPKSHIEINETPTGFQIKTKQAPQLQVMLFETLILSIFNELYAKGWAKANNVSWKSILKTGHNILESKMQLLQQKRELGTLVPYMEFGTRRRASYEWQNETIKFQKEHNPQGLLGTSNIHFGIKHNLKILGTFGHEFPMMLQGIYAPHTSQSRAFKHWLEEYHGLWGTALGDTLGDEKFFSDFELQYARAYQGVKHDSGCPVKYGQQIINMYNNYNINPKSKNLVFSDSIHIPTKENENKTTAEQGNAIKLAEKFQDKIGTTFGIGTNLTNDMGKYYTVPQIVMKMTSCNGQPVAKLSNNSEKNTYHDPDYIVYLKKAIKNSIEFKKQKP